jgi:hypothetical protein
MDSSFDSLEGAFEAARNDFTATEDDPWSSSPYRWLRELQSRTRGKAGEQIITSWLRSEGLTVGRAGSSNSDRRIELTEVEIKMSTRWDSGEYRFQQIRDQEYKFVILLGVSPEQLNVWILPKKVALKHSTPQHTGKTGAETRWLSFPAAEPPAWLARYGGTSEQGLDAVKRYLLRPAQAASTPNVTTPNVTTPNVTTPNEPITQDSLSVEGALTADGMSASQHQRVTD